MGTGRPVVVEVIQQLRVGIEFVHETRQAKGTILPEGDKGVKLRFQGNLQKDHTRVGNRDSNLDNKVFGSGG